MNHRVDEQFAELVHRAAPAARDPMFRLKVLERREHERFRRQSLLLVTLALAVAGVAAAGLSLGPATFDALGVVLFGIVVSAVGFVYAPLLLRRLRLFRS